jgi:Tfp pilus assembly protein PilV
MADRQDSLCRALTLIEALVSSVLLGVGVAGLMSAATVGLRNEQKMEQRTFALYLAKAKLAQVETVGPHIWSQSEPMKGTETQKGIVYDWTISIDQLSAGELFDVRVTTDWAGPTGQGTIELETWLNDYEAKAVNKAVSENQANPPAAGAVSPG